MSKSTKPGLENDGKFKVVDLFCGCGGLTQGFVETGFFNPVWANDNNEESVLTYRKNFDPTGAHSFIGGIEEVLDDKCIKIPRADVVMGGPPCQGFSLLNKKRGPQDKRRQLWYQFLRAVESSKAHTMVMENVPQLLASPEFLEIKGTLREMGFKYLAYHVLSAANYGVPQTRQRAIIIASKKFRVTLPRPTHLKPQRISKIKGEDWAKNIQPWATVKDVIWDLPKPIGTEIREEQAPLNLHFGRTPTPTSLERYKAVPPGGNRFNLLEKRPDITPDCWKRKTSGGTDLFGRLWWDRPSVTIRTEFFKPEKGRYLHPVQHRPITHREAARIQAFPDDFVFEGSKIEIAKQIGNAVPIGLARAVAREVARALRGEVDRTYQEETEILFSRLLDETITHQELI